MFKSCSGETAAASALPLKLTYFPLFAKGPSVALALEMSGLNWEGFFPEDWKTMKSETPFGSLPVLEIPGIGQIGHEAAILNYIGREVPRMAGDGKKDFVTSQQLLAEAEDIYKALQAKQDTILQKDKVSQDVYDKFWGEPDGTTHNKEFGVKMYLKLVEDFYKKVGGKDGKFTASGKTVGECKMWVTLHILVMVQADVLDKFEGLSEFYKRMGEERETKALILHGCRMPGPFPQGYIPKSFSKAAEGGA
eukprot:CAMPEP_0194764814 /NCGR_PEP_ID=MMETSP0323_2-20130528/23812_1 /TAXON_ID=2866 ORGANISM="Crypthecodinium cohnii, Strain Seligo" /NCGR_SAMPLE_ID=MMETSP0323_2 /ASSEMBLY_ACC=CAM_ASM_000346 /LENGTH=249 /DNA_ID=CAMNT_0039692825 /DNA_START=57 /DNA_END=806 /DNA_ORIENTATION=+